MCDHLDIMKGTQPIYGPGTHETVSLPLALVISTGFSFAKDLVNIPITAYILSFIQRKQSFQIYHQLFSLDLNFTFYSSLLEGDSVNAINQKQMHPEC